MKKALLILIQIFVFIFAANGNEEPGEDSALSFDKPIAQTMEFRFDIEEDLYPDQSTFKIVDFAFLSNEKGERAALVNLTNTAVAPRTLAPNQIYGFFADGTYRRPTNSSDRIDGGKTNSVLLSFGVSKTPLVKLIVRNF
ncbi:MAG: hypothetical protein ACKVGW_14935 [Verrucomicrobiia bacterium]|jgi:hypothetical protein